MSEFDPLPEPDEYPVPDEPVQVTGEVDAADAADQRRPVNDEDASDDFPPVSRDDVDPADAVDQEVTVEVDDDDYR